jgi:type IV pilus assembly protein PilM
VSALVRSALKAAAQLPMLECTRSSSPARMEVGLAQRVSIGLDIGSSAVRAAQVSSQGRRAELARFAQVGLPAGAVVEGEVKDRGAVADALKRLWSAGGFRQREVVLGVSSQRSMVRVVEMPKLASAELRSAVRYQIAELLPIGVDEAVFDSVVLGPGKPSGDGGETVQMLLVVAQRDTVLDHIGVLRRAGLRARAVDSSPLALLRALPKPAGDGLEAVVCLGANLVVVAVRQGLVPKFVRTVAKAGEVSQGGVPQGAGASAPQGAQARKPARSVVGDGLDPTVEEVRGSLEYFHSHSQHAPLERVLVTGGGALAKGMIERLSAVLGVPVVQAEVALAYSPEKLGLTRAQVETASLRWTTAAGLALWGVDNFPAPSLVPQEVKERRQFQRALTASAAGLLVVAGGLGALSYQRAHEASNIAREVKAEDAQAASLQSEIARLQPSTAIQADLRSRASLAEAALSGDIDWVRLVHRIEAALPPGVSITSLSLSRSLPSASSSGTAGSTSPAAAASGDDLGQATMALTAKGGPTVVAEFVRRMWDVGGLYALWVSNEATTGSGPSAVTTFSATAQLTSKALSDRVASIPGVSK